MYCKRIIRVIFIVVIMFILNLFKLYKDEELKINQKLDQFYLEIGTMLTATENEHYFLSFDYEKINRKINDIFDGQVNLIKNNEMEFIIEVEISKFGIKRTIKEKFYLRKGENYEKFN